jgi:hypothetical protein
MACAMVQLSSGMCDCFQSDSVIATWENYSLHCMYWFDFDISLCSFDHFHIIRQGLLLSIDTFGVSHILPILSLPFIALVWCNTASKDTKAGIANIVTQVLKVKEKSLFSWSVGTAQQLNTQFTPSSMYLMQLKYTSSSNTSP